MDKKVVINMGFSNDFMWGVATAAYQIEGAYNEEGKGPGIWDVYSRLPQRIKYNENGDISCDHYHLYKEDITLMKEMGIKYYRFSISWPRIFPEGVHNINEKGLAFYSELVDTLLANDITPLVTLYHWNYPNALQRKGGWLNPESSEWFAEYVKVVVNRLSDRVKYWITFNEPQVFVGLGYKDGTHAPFCKLPTSELIQISHNILLAHGKAVRIIREYAKQPPIIGFAPTGPCTIPDSNSDEAIESAREKSFSLDEGSFIFSNTWWGDPIIFGHYPKEAYIHFGKDMPTIAEEEMKIISTPIDFYGANIYQSQNAFNTQPKQGAPTTALGWSITPEVLYWSSKFLYERYGLPILITENGMAGPDFIYSDGHIHDYYRINFLSQYLSALKRAAEDNVKVIGYMHWSFMDNFEWAEGYTPRFGLVYVEYETQRRIIKDSGYWYKKVIQSNGEILSDDIV